MELRQLRLFVAVAEEGNFTRAAERVNLSQPALSHRIRGLEDELGVPLFLRTARGASLTAAGEALLSDARHLLDDASAARQRVRRAGGLSDDTARIGFDFVAFGGVAPMPSLLSTFRQRFPDMQLSLQVLESAAVEEALTAGQLDLGFLLGPLQSAELKFHPLLSGVYQLLLPALHPLAVLASVRRAALLEHPLVLPRLGAGADDDLSAYLSLPGRVPQLIHRGTEVAALGGLVAAGEGVALLPSVLVPAPLGSAVVVRELEDAPVWRFGLAWRDVRPSPLTQAGQQLIRQMVPHAVSV
jgi:DNA-binding transcriptional LysR family regulator